MTMNRFCSSGLQALATGASEIVAGWSQIVLTGGVESMSLVPMGGQKPAPNPWLAANWPSAYESMGITSETVASRYGVSRADQDAFGVASNAKALAAIKAGRFKDEIIPITTTVDGKEVVFDTDDGPRESTVEGLGKLRPAFKVDGVSTAGNSSQTSDGAALALLMPRAKAEELGFAPLGELVTFQVAGVDPDEMGIGPAVAIPKALKAAGLEAKDIGLFEINEAFASQALYCVRQLGIDPERGQRQRRGHRPGPPPGVHRRQAHRQPAARDEAAAGGVRRRQHVHRRRHGSRGDLPPRLSPRTVGRGGGVTPPPLRVGAPLG